MVETEIGVMWPQARECWQPLDDGKDKEKDFPLESLEEMLSYVPILDFCLSEL